MSKDIGDYIYIARVLEVYPATYTARVEVIDSKHSEYGAILECRILALRLSADGSTSVQFPMPTDTVYISLQRSASSPDIIGYIPEAVRNPNYVDHQQQLTPLEGVGATDTSFNGGKLNIKGQAPGDVLPGDSLDIGKAGNGFAKLTGGSLLVKAGALSQIVLTKLRSTIKIVSRRLHIYTDFGEIVSESENGAAYLSISGNTTVQKSNKTIGNYDYNIKLGGQNYYAASFAGVYSTHINKSGGMHTEASYVDNTYYNNSINTYFASYTTSSKLDYTKRVGRNYTWATLGNYKAHTRGKHSTTVLGSCTEIVGGESRATYQGIRAEVVKGISITSKSRIAKSVKIGTGDYTIKIGDLSLGIPVAPILGSDFGSYDCLVTNGDISQETYTGKYLAKAKQRATIDGGAHVELVALVAALEANMKHLDGMTGSQDPVVTALRLQTEITTKIITKFNMHTHPVNVSTASGGPGSGIASPTSSSMSPLAITAISNNRVVS